MTTAMGWGRTRGTCPKGSGGCDPNELWEAKAPPTFFHLQEVYLPEELEEAVVAGTGSGRGGAYA